MRLSQRNKRPAFTLIELIVVITILTVVAALTIGAIGKSFNWIKQKNTEQTMTKVILRLQRVIDRLYKEADDWPTGTEQLILDQAGGSFERARILKVLYLYKWNFPNSYAEAFHNVQESRLLYDNTVFNIALPADPKNFPGYPPARALFEKLRSNFQSGIPPLSNPPQGTALLTPVNLAKAVPEQSAACMLAAFTTANGSPDEFSNNEVLVDNSNGDGNPRLVDAWGTPFLFLRQGNFIYSNHTTSIATTPQPAWGMGMVNPASPPLEAVLNPSGSPSSYYFQQLQARSLTAYGSSAGKDPFDPTGLLFSNVPQLSTSNVTQWAKNGYRSPSWLSVPWLAPATVNENAVWFRSTFGYPPEATPSMGFCPMLILSAGGDKLFTTWDDNLDSYRLQVNVSGQQ